MCGLIGIPAVAYRDALMRRWLLKMISRGALRMALAFLTNVESVRMRIMLR
jgi:hypothetical protein